MKGDVQLVVAVVIFTVDGGDHLIVDPFHFGRMRRAEFVENGFDYGAFQGTDNAEDVFYVFNRQRVDHNTAAREDSDETVALLADNRISQRRFADAKLFTDLVEFDKCARQQSAGVHFVAKIGVKLFSQRP